VEPAQEQRQRIGHPFQRVWRRAVAGEGQLHMTKCFEPLSDLATLSAKSSKWKVLIGRTGLLSTLSC